MDKTYYYLTCLASYHDLNSVLLAIYILSLVGLLFIYILLEDYRENIIQFIKKYKTVIIICSVCMCLVEIFIPSKKDIRYMYVSDKVIDYVENSDIMIVHK